MTIGSLFSGIGGLELGLERAGLGRTVWQVEQSPFCRSVLAQHWPDARRFDDVRSVGAATLFPVDVICGGFPCQDVSAAGKGEGLAGRRSGLWREYARIVCEMRPRWVVVENVASGAKRWVDAVCAELGELGYATLPVPLSAADVGAPHLRRRIFVIARAADPDSKPVRDEQQRGPGRRTWGLRAEREDVAMDDGGARAAANAHGGRFRKRADRNQEAPNDSGADWHTGPTVSPVCGVDDGVPRRVDRLRGLGNAVVPQCAEVIGWMIREMEGGES